MGAMTLFAVSCYDDTALWGEIDRLDGRVDSLANVLNKDVAALAALQSTVADLETSLTAAIAEGDAAVKKALEDQLAKVKTDLEKAVADGDKALADALAGEKTAIEKALTDLTTGLTSVTGSVENLQAALATFEATVGKSYEDLLAQLDELDGLVDGTIADFTAALKALQAADQQLNTELVAAIAKIAVVKVDDVDGKIVLTLADGKTVEVSKPLTNVDNNGLVTMVDVDGVKYWQVVGAAEHTGVQVGHPDQKIEFQINGETNELEYRVNGSAWTSTGVNVQATAENVKVITGLEQTDDYVKLTVGGAEIVLPKFKVDNASLLPSRTDFFLRYGGSKNIELVAEGVAEYYVMAKPDGWKATIDGTTLAVYAPQKSAVEVAAAEIEGEILIHATTDLGKCKVVKIDVTTGPGLTLAVDAKGNITVENSYYGKTVSMWGEESFGFSDFILGIATPEEFLADPVKYVETYNSTYSAPNDMDIIYPSFYNFAEQGMYVEGEYETDVVKATVRDAYFNVHYQEFPAGTSFVIWVAPIVGEGLAVIEDVLYVEYTHIVHEVVATEVTHSDITLVANCEGAEAYVVKCVAESYYNSEWNPTTFEDYMNASMGGPWKAFVNYGAMEAMGAAFKAEELPDTLKMSEILGEKLAAGENYKVWVMPIVKLVVNEAESYPEEDYYVYDFSGLDFKENFMPYVLDVKTNDLVAGGDHAATYALESADFKNIYVNVTLSEGTESVFYAWYTADQYNEFENDEAVIADLNESCMSPLAANGKVSKTYANPGEEWILASYSVGTDGKYGAVVVETFSTMPVPYTEDLKVELVSCELDAEGTTYTVTVNVTGAAKVMGYNVTHSEYNLSSFPVNVAVNGHKTSYYGYQMADVVDGKAVLTFAKSTYKKDYYVAAYNVAEGVVSEISETSLNIHLFD